MDSGGGGVLARWPERAGVVWLLVALFLMMLGLAKGIPPLLLLSATLVAAFLVNVLFASFPLRRLEAGITEDGDLVAGEPGLVVFQVWSANPVSSDVHFYLKGSEDWVGLPGRMTSGQPCRLRLEAHPVRRGWMELPPLVVATSYPFGLVRCVRDLCRGQKALVVPAAGKVQTAGMLRFLERRQARQELETRANRVRPSSMGEFHGLRPWRAGDSSRLIHWRTSARFGQPMVREHEAPGRQALLVLVDPGCLPGEWPVNEQAEWERMLRLAAGIVRVWLRGSDRWLGLAVAGREPAFFHSQGGAGENERAMLRALALCDPAPSPPEWPEPPANLPANLLTLRLCRESAPEPTGRFGMMSRRDLLAGKVGALPWFEDVDAEATNRVREAAP